LRAVAFSFVNPARNLRLRRLSANPLKSGEPLNARLPKLIGES
jgi:hypothetical protein